MPISSGMRFSDAAQKGITVLASGAQPNTIAGQVWVLYPCRCIHTCLTTGAAAVVAPASLYVTQTNDSLFGLEAQLGSSSDITYQGTKTRHRGRGIAFVRHSRQHCPLNIESLRSPPPAGFLLLLPPAHRESQLEPKCFSASGFSACFSACSCPHHRLAHV